MCDLIQLYTRTSGVKSFIKKICKLVSIMETGKSIDAVPQLHYVTLTLSSMYTVVLLKVEDSST